VGVPDPEPEPEPELLTKEAIYDITSVVVI
jgi:hypothetical protein